MALEKFKNDELLPEVDLDPKLSRALGFDQRDLDTNREGCLSKRQQETLHKRGQNRFMLGMGGALAMAVIALMGILPAVVSQESDQGTLAFAFVGTFAAFCIGFGALERHKAQRDHEDNTALAVEGRIELVLGDHVLSFKVKLWELIFHFSIERPPAFKVIICGMTFNIAREAFLAFQNGALYRIYYTPRTKVILSAERLAEQ